MTSNEMELQPWAIPWFRSRSEDQQELISEKYQRNSNTNLDIRKLVTQAAKEWLIVMYYDEIDTYRHKNPDINSLSASVGGEKFGITWSRTWFGKWWNHFSELEKGQIFSTYISERGGFVDTKVPPTEQMKMWMEGFYTTEIKNWIDSQLKVAVNHPSHYGGDTTYEAIKVIEAWELDFPLGNTVKYISRAGKKDPTKELEDLEKAAWYLNRKIENLKSKKNELLSKSNS